MSSHLPLLSTVPPSPSLPAPRYILLHVCVPLADAFHGETRVVLWSYPGLLFGLLIFRTHCPFPSLLPIRLCLYTKWGNQYSEIWMVFDDRHLLISFFHFIRRVRSDVMVTCRLLTRFKAKREVWKVRLAEKARKRIESFGEKKKRKGNWHKKKKKTKNRKNNRKRQRRYRACRHGFLFFFLSPRV